MTMPQSKKPRRVWRWIAYVLISLAVLIVALAVAGALYQSSNTTRDARTYLPSGQMVDVGGHALHLKCIGNGSPTVILEAGLRGTSLDWELVQPSAARFTRTCAYDRAGYGWSDTGPKPRDGNVVAKELHTLLAQAGVPGPYVLVGHSLGGLYVRVFASQYADEVTGLVLVDATPDDLWSRSEFPKPSFGAKVNLYVGCLLAPLGVARLLRQPVSNLYLDNHFPSAIQQASEATGYRSQAVSTTYEEFSNFDEAMIQSRQLNSFDNRPLAVLVHGLANNDTGRWAEDNRRKEQVWKELQAELARLSTNSRLIVAEKSRHFIQFDQPDLVIDQIQKVVEAARNGTQLMTD